MHKCIKKSKNMNSLFILKLNIILLLIINIIIIVFNGKYFQSKFDYYLIYNYTNNKTNEKIYNQENELNKNKTDFSNDLVYNSSNKKISNISSFETLYITTKKNEKVILINKLYNIFIKEVIIGTIKINKTYEYVFPEPGEHHIITFLNMENINTTELMFCDINNLISINFEPSFFNQDIKSLHGMFKGCKNLKYINLNNNEYSKIIDLSYTFFNCLSLIFLNCSSIVNNNTLDISYAFANCISLSSIDISSFDTINIKNMSGLFYNCSSLASINLSFFNTSHVLNMDYMFAGCSSLSIVNMSFLDFSNLINMRYMFKNCLQLTSVLLPNLEKKIDINKEKIFYGCNKINQTKYDICIVGSWFAYNYGCMSTYYALHQTIKNMGYSILMISSPRDFYGKNLGKCHPVTIAKQLYNISTQKTLNKLHEFNNECKTFLVGSDQIWRPSISGYYKNFFFLNFVENNKKKISYSTSFGAPYNGTKLEKALTKKYLNRFNRISVRDRLTLNITKNIFGLKNVTQVCDPTFICNFSEYESLINKSRVNINYEYILAYVLDPTAEKGNRLEKLSLYKNITVIILLEENQYLWKKNKEKLHLSGKGKIFVKKNVDLNDFMWYYNHSKAVFTDSFHGTVFSIIFKKPFVTLRNIERGGERFSSLLEPIDLSYRLFESSSCINEQHELYDKIDYEIPYQKLKKIINFSYNWLTNALKT